MPIYHRMGDLPAKRHITHPKDDSGSLYHEELIGNMGFAGISSLVYHAGRPTAIKQVELVREIPLEAEERGALRHRHLRTFELPSGGSPTLDRTPLLFNSDVTILFSRTAKTDDHFYRNGGADEFIFVCEGSGQLDSLFGRLKFGPGDQLIIPRGVTYRFAQLDGEAKLLVAETRGFLRFPPRYRNEFGQLLEGAPFCERHIRPPAVLQTHDEAGDFEVIVKHHGALTRMVVDHHPFDAIGWDGYYYPWAFNIHEFEPITGMIHQPPPIHQFIEADGLVICDFCPRPFDFHEQAVPAPYNHSNVMSDEVLFYASDSFMSRKGIDYGSITLHPDGLPHGPHPGRYAGSVGQQRTEELAVMIDTFCPLQVSQQALAIEDAQYFSSWLAKP